MRKNIRRLEEEHQLKRKRERRIRGREGGKVRGRVSGGVMVGGEQEVRR